ncbi:MAG: hypothetical protein HYR56_10360 [Acidobacteria bacterium]|nr:hypothetical protein [Acidobacteriota bacterium]MBI3425637.1 hypothetical protein [Acidobacteriota bacterium]
MPRHSHSSQPDDDYDDAPPPPKPPRRPERRKPLVRLACPSCGGIVSANALDGEGTTQNTCGKCEGTIWIETDETGAIVGIDGQANEEKKSFEGDWRIFAAVGAVVFLIILYLLSIRATPLSPLHPAAPSNQSQVERVP